MNNPQTSSVFRPYPHILVPILLIIVAIFLQYAGGDEWLIRPFFNEVDQSWPYESLWITAGLLHKGGKDLIVAIGAGVVLLLMASIFVPRLKAYRRDLMYTVLAMGSGLGVVALLKATTHIYSPSALEIYGGTMPHIRLFDHVPPGLPVGKAFPAGHASGAYSLIAVYFLFAIHGSKWKYPALATSLTLGIIYGVCQQARGKHFLSHDFFSLAICWSCALLFVYVLGMPRKSGASVEMSQE